MSDYKNKKQIFEVALQFQFISVPLAFVHTSTCCLNLAMAEYAKLEAALNL